MSNPKEVATSIRQACERAIKHHGKIPPVDHNTFFTAQLALRTAKSMYPSNELLRQAKLSEWSWTAIHTAMRTIELCADES